MTTTHRGWSKTNRKNGHWQDELVETECDLKASILARIKSHPVYHVGDREVRNAYFPDLVDDILEIVASELTR